MTEGKFIELVKKKANHNVQQKIQQFRVAIKQAFAGLTGSAHLYIGSESWTVLKNIVEMGDVDQKKNWPVELWEVEEKQVMADILGTMDAMQKALVAPEATDDDDKPAPKPEV